LNSKSRRKCARPATRKICRSRCAIRKACDAYARKYIDIQRTQFKRLGVLGDWENPYLTLNKEYEADELRLFADIVEKGFVYRGKKPVYWSIPCRTALAEAEVEYHDHVSQSVFVKFPVVGRRKLSSSSGRPRRGRCPRTSPSLTTRISNTSKSRRRRKLHFVSRFAAGRRRKMRLDEFHRDTVPDRRTRDELQYQHPFCNRTGKAFAADFRHERHRHGLRSHRARPRLGRLQSRPPKRPADLFARGRRRARLFK
jgi:hypothetical protein